MNRRGLLKVLGIGAAIAPVAALCNGTKGGGLPGKVVFLTPTEPLSDACKEFASKGAIIADVDTCMDFLRKGLIEFEVNSNGERYPMLHKRMILLSDLETKKFRLS